MTESETFKEISVGGLEKGLLLQRLIETGVQFNEYAQVLFETPCFLPDPRARKVQLAKLRLSDLRLEGPCSYEEVIRRASSLGLSLCPLSLGAFLRLEYLDQPEGPYLTVATAPPEPVPGPEGESEPDSDAEAKAEKSDGLPTGFYLRKLNGALWLRGYRAIGECDWPGNNEFVFLKLHAAIY